MCKGISVVLTKEKVYWSAKSNSHEEIKKKNSLRDTAIDGLLIAETYPRGKSIFSRKDEDWEVVFENKPSWFDEHRDKDRVRDFLYNTIFSQWKKDQKIVAYLNLSNLNYSSLPDDLGDWATEVNCYSNQLTSLSLPKATRVDCYSNQLTSLSLPKATRVDCSHNQLTSLSLPKATRVDCSDNPKQFTEKDWKK
jgi:hypothetical protein